MGLGTTELIIIFMVVLLLFGGKKIPEIARGLGKGMREFRKAKDDLHSAIEEDLDEKPRKRKKTAVKIETAEKSNENDS